MDNHHYKNQFKSNEEEQEEDNLIPVFTVLKNNAILKNIFLLQNPLLISNQSSVDKFENTNSKPEELLTVGRHPDCTILLTHPSISRFHLRIYLEPSLQKLWVIDLSSVHGTWVSDRKIEPGVRVELKEGDTIQLGCSSRIYRLHWVFLNCAFELENPIEDYDTFSCKDKQLELLDSISEVVESFYSEDTLECSITNEVTSAPFITNDLQTDELFDHDEKISNHSCSLKEDHEHMENTIPCFESIIEELSLDADSYELSDDEIISNHGSFEEDLEQIENIVPSLEPIEGLSLDVNCENVETENQLPVELHEESSFQYELSSLCVSEIEFKFENSSEFNLVENPSSSTNLVSEKDVRELERENETPTPLYTTDEVSEQNLSIPNIWSRRGKPVGVLQIQAEVGTDQEVNSKHGDKENEDENYTPNKENLTPYPRSVMIKWRYGMEKEKKHSTPYQSFSPNVGTGSPMLGSANKENQTPKVLQERKLARKSSSRNRVRRIERVPLQSLPLNSASSPVNCMQSLDNNTILYSKKAAGDVKKRWYMVVDSSCFLDKDSMKALQLLQGVKGTQLIIPRIVIRELDDLKHRVSLFRRTSTKASTALKWIEECVASSNKWWIHVQSSFNEGMRVALTPASSWSSYGEDGISEDLIIEYALLYKRLEKDGLLVLLSDNISLKIKAMAEGVICETANEFRESLVNPFSERFMWAESSPRGQTWSCLDDIVLRGLYYGGFPYKEKKPKGLKLVLQ